MLTHKAIRKLYPVLLLLLSGVPFFAFAADTSFIPLTSIPGIDISTAPTLPAFLNSLYKLCIGAAAVVAILQIMRAGVQIMRANSGSFLANKEAKDLISSAVIGLVLVLSPYFVFSIINPSILDLNLDVSGLQVPLNHIDSATTSASVAPATKEDFKPCAEVTSDPFRIFTVCKN